MKLLIWGAVAAALLLPALAHAKVRAAGPMMMGVERGIACDIGPNYMGRIPAAAVANGFTHCAANYDFSSTSNFTYNGDTYNFSRPDTWLDCDITGSNTPLWWNLSYSGGTTAPCSRYSIISDASFGTNVLQSIYEPSDWSNGENASEIDTQNQTSPPNGSGTGNFFPTEFYTEIAQRVTSDTQDNAYPGASCGSGPIFASTFAWAAPTAVETDYNEFYAGGDSCTNGGNTYDHSNSVGLYPGNNGGQPGQQSGYDPTAVHVYGTLQTSDSSSDFTRCNYLDGTELGCDGPATFSSGALTTRTFLKITDGPETTSANQPSVNLDYRVQRITIWECSGWQTGHC